MFQFAIFFLCGNLVLQGSAQLPVSGMTRFTSQCLFVTAILTLCLGGAVMAGWPTRQVWRSTHRHVLLSSLALCSGFLWAWCHAHWRNADRLDPALEGQDIVIQGYVRDLPEVDRDGQRFLLEVAVPTSGVPQRVQLMWYSPPTLVRAAQQWRLVVRLKQPHGFANPGGQDYALQLFRQGIGATGYIRNDDRNQLLGEQPYQGVLKARAAVIAHIEQALPQHPVQGIVRGLAVGDQQAISPEEWRTFSRTGVSHLMAISGFHVGMVAWLFAAASRVFLWLPMAQRGLITAPRLRSVCGMTGALGYSLLAGMSVPTTRTLIMLGVYFVSLWSRRALDVWHGFGVALLLVLLVDPFAPLSVGPWLSFGAVAVILLNQHGRLGEGIRWRQFLTVQGMVTIGLTPLLLACFGNLSLVSPVVNLVAIPWFSVVLAPAVLMGAALMFLNASLGQLWLQTVAWLLLKTYDLLQWAASLPWAIVHLPALPWWVLACLTLGTLMMVIPWSLRLRAAGALLCVPMFLWQPSSLPMGSVRITTLDVGQGLAVVIQTHRHVLLYDMGPAFPSGRNTGEMVVLPYLHAMGIRKLDMAMASHGDADHVGGLADVLQGMPVTQLVRGPSVKAVDTRDVLCRQGMQWTWDDIRFTVLHPDLTQLERSDNNQSCVLRMDAPGGSMLLMGDAERRVEERLVTDQSIAPVTIVAAGHHGSRSSSSESFVVATQARHVVFSAGYRNRWKFPSDEVVTRWQQHGATTLTTIYSGAVAYTLSPGQVLQVERYRPMHPHYWMPDK